MTAKILVIEDTPGIRRLIRMTLEFDGFAVVEATDGEVGLNLIRSEQPALVLMDVAMPGINGLEACKRIRNDPHTAQTPVVMLSMANSAEDIQRGMDAGATHYLTKPFLPTQLLDLVHQLTVPSGAGAGSISAN